MVAHENVAYRASPWGTRFHYQRDANGRVIDEVLGAGSSGPGKTEALLWDVSLQMQREEARQHLPRDHPHFVERGGSQGRGLLLRRSSPMLRDLKKRGLAIFRKLNDGLDGWSATNSTFTFKCGYEITLGHCYERDDVENYVGVSWTWIGFDELIQFLAEQYHTIKLWMRSYDPALAHDLRVRSASNPVFLRKNSEDFEIDDPFWVRRYFVEPFPQGDRILVDTRYLEADNITYRVGDLARVRTEAIDPEPHTVIAVNDEGSRYKVALGDRRGPNATEEGEWVPYETLAGKFYERTRMYMPATIDDNPDPNYRESQRRNLLGAPRHIREALLKGNWFHQTGGYFEAVWNPDIHVVKPYAIPREWKIWRSMDWGFKTTGVVHWYAMDQDENVVIFMEYTFKGKEADIVAQRIMERESQLGLTYKKRSLLTGPADSQLWELRGDNAPSKASTMAKLGVSWRRATKDRQANAEYVYKRLHDHDDFKTTPGLTVFATCTETIKFAFNIMTDPKEPNVPRKGGNDHHYDSVSYGVRFAQKGSAAIPSHTSVRKALEKGGENDHANRGKDGYGG